ncbi:DUF2971 domain-containing protein [uncultured Christiangramia sp.]|uniref:DUF2971 domain-containing protein n=1 Tax=Christiangramia sp. 3-2217-3z TaxID=3417564 RepID=UPI00262DA1A5|nr:DUF2971 domain-containing protein [uncultured Christiangramia sp.]
MFKFSPINTYALRNLQKNQIYFNNPLKFNDPFDTFHPAKITEITNEKFVDLYCRTTKRNFDKRKLLGILENNVSKKDFYDFCDKHLDYLFDFKNPNNNQVLRSKDDFLEHIKSQEGSKQEFIENIGSFFLQIKLHLQKTIQETLDKVRQESFSKIGVTCFSKNNSNLLMWSHYADSHQGFCLEFDSKIEPFSKHFEVIYRSEIPNVISDLLFDEENDTESIRKLLSYKSLDWKHEEEIRIFHQESNKSYFYSPQALKAIYFGIRTNPSDIEIVCSIVKAQNPDVNFYIMEKQSDTFSIKPKLVVYNTVMEIQSTLIFIISKLFKNQNFTVKQLHDKTSDKFSEIQLEAHLNDLTRKKVLIRNNGTFKLTN